MFKELKALMLVRNTQLSEAYFVSNFVSGLKEEIKAMVKILKPTKLIDAFEIAELQEQNLEVQNKKGKGIQKGLLDQKFGLFKNKELQFLILIRFPWEILLRRNRNHLF